MSTPRLSTDRRLWSYVTAVRPVIEEALVQHLPVTHAAVDGCFNEALRYALFPGGKRLRPVLTLLGADLVSGSKGNGAAAAVGSRRRAVLAAATAVEYVHTSSLIFDDLPCMDDAAQRRGRAAVHRQFGEALAVLIALALMNASYGLVFDDESPNYQQSLQAHRELVACIGANGMVVGQTVDVTCVAQPSHCNDVRNLKTSALIGLALKLGAILSGANAQQIAALERFAELVGDAYQLSDDVLDLTEDAELAATTAIGAATTTAGMRRASTLAIEHGPHTARHRLVSLTTQAKRVLAAEFNESPPVRLLGEFADYLVKRET